MIQIWKEKICQKINLTHLSYEYLFENMVELFVYFQELKYMEI